MTESIAPRPNPTPEINYQPSMMSLRSAASTVAPEDQAPISAQQAKARSPRRKLWFFTALSVMAGVASASMLGKPAQISTHVQSGSPGFKRSSTGKDLHWNKKALIVYLDDSLDQIGPGANEAVMQAFGQWVSGDPRLPDLSFDTGKVASSPEHDGKSTVSYGRIKLKGHEQDLAVTISYADDTSGEMLEADIVLNSLYPVGVLTAKAAGQTTTVLGNGGKGEKDAEGARKTMHGDDESVDCKNRYDAQNAMTHEAGHFFGLGEDMTERHATMFLSIDQCETHKRVLAATDLDAVGTLYAQTEDPEEAVAEARACSFGRASDTGGAFAISGLILGVSVLRRRPAC